MAGGCHGRWARKRDDVRPLPVHRYLGRASVSAFVLQKEPVNKLVRIIGSPPSNGFVTGRVNLVAMNTPKSDRADHWPARPCSLLSPPSRYDSFRRKKSQEI
jgi:hypothetical protein